MSFIFFDLIEFEHLPVEHILLVTVGLHRWSLHVLLLVLLLLLLLLLLCSSQFSARRRIIHQMIEYNAGVLVLSHAWGLLLLHGLLGTRRICLLELLHPGVVPGLIDVAGVHVTRSVVEGAALGFVRWPDLVHACFTVLGGDFIAGSD